MTEPFLTLSKIVHAVDIGINTITSADLLSYKTSFWKHLKCIVLFQKGNSSYHTLLLISNLFHTVVIYV